MEHLRNLSKGANQNTLSLTTMRLALSGAIIGIAIMGILSNSPYHELVGAIVGGLAVIFAKAKHFI
jgi:hypothetical protein